MLNKISLLNKELKLDKVLITIYIQLNQALTTQKNSKENSLQAIKKLFNKHSKMDKVSLMKTQKLIKSNMMKKEKKSKEFAIQSSKKEWVKVEKALVKMTKIGMMKIFDCEHIIFDKKYFKY